MQPRSLEVMRALDEIDHRILHALQLDPRQPVSRIAKQVGLTDNAVRYRVRRLQTGGIIREFVTVVDPRLLGRPVFGIVLAQLREPVAFADFLRELPEAVGGYEGRGDANACLFVFARDEAEWKHVVDRLRAHPLVSTARCLRVEAGHRVSPMPLYPSPLGMENSNLPPATGG